MRVANTVDADTSGTAHGEEAGKREHKAQIQEDKGAKGGSLKNTQRKALLRVDVRAVLTQGNAIACQELSRSLLS